MKLLLINIFFLLTILSCDKENTIPSSNQDLNWIRDNTNPILKAGFDAMPGKTALSVSDPSFIFDAQENKWKMWIAIGWFENEQFKTGIKYAESVDGINWDVHDKICLKPSNISTAWDFTSVETPMVLKLESNPTEKKYIMWYSGGNITINPLGEDYPRFQIGMAYSADGITFNKISESDSPYQQEGLVLRVEDAFPSLPSVSTGIVADPSVIFHDNKLKMWFTSIGLTENDEDVDGGICYAESEDGINWLADNANPIQSLKRISEDFVAQPTVLFNKANSEFEMWFNADYESELTEVGMNGTIGFWHAHSADGKNWIVNRENGRDMIYGSNLDSEKYGLTVGCSVLHINGEYVMIYGGLASKELSQTFENPWPYLHVINRAIKE